MTERAQGVEGRTVAVTGASGAIGAALVRYLAESGAVVRGLTRSQEGASRVIAAGGEPRIGDVADPEALRELFDGADLAAHLAAWMGGKGGVSEARRVNVAGTRAVVEAAGVAGVARLAHVSSIAVYGPALSGEVDETHPVRMVGDAYGDTKLQGESEAVRVAAAAGIELTVLRPTMVYGPGVASWTLTPLRALAAGVPMTLGDGRSLLDAVYVDDAARAIGLALTADGAAGRAFNVVGRSVTWNEFFGAYAAMLGRPLRRTPAWLARAGARAAGVVTRPLGPARVVPEMVEVMLSNATFSGAPAREVLDYEPAVGLGEGMRRTARWLREAGHLAGPRGALVVGAGSGLGLAVATELTRRYVPVVAADLSPPEPSPAGATGEVLHAVAVDVLKPDSLKHVVAHAAELGVEVDAAVITVGALKPGALESQPIEDVRWQLDLNALGPLNVARAVAPGMRGRGRGRIVAVGSTNGLLVTPFMGAYSAGKFALEAFIDALRLELRPFGVEVVLVQPGAMRTTFAERAKERLAVEAARTGNPWDEPLLRLRDADLWGEKTAADPALVARIVTNAVTSRKASARVNGTREVPFLRLFSYLPDRLKDLVFERPLGLKRPRVSRR